MDVEAHTETENLRDECRDFIERVDQFHKVTGTFVQTQEQLAEIVNREKMKALGARNLIKTLAKQREAEGQQLRTVIAEKETELARLSIQFEALQRAKREQEQLISQFTA